MFGIAAVDDFDVIRQCWQALVIAAERWPIGFEMEPLVLVAEAIEEVRRIEGQCAINPAPIVEIRGRRQTRGGQSLFNHLPFGDLEATMFCTEAPGQFADDE